MMTYDEDQQMPIAIPLETLKQQAAAVAEELKAAADAVDAGLRERFINVRAALFQRGIFDPVLVRFDSATAPRATVQEIAEQLAAVATNL
jgi:hypothetical protein